MAGLVFFSATVLIAPALAASSMPLAVAAASFLLRASLVLADAYSTEVDSGRNALHMGCVWPAGYEIQSISTGRTRVDPSATGAEHTLCMHDPAAPTSQTAPSAASSLDSTSGPCCQQ